MCVTSLCVCYLCVCVCRLIHACLHIAMMAVQLTSHTQSQHHHQQLTPLIHVSFIIVIIIIRLHRNTKYVDAAYSC